MQGCWRVRAGTCIAVRPSAWGLSWGPAGCLATALWASLMSAPAPGHAQELAPEVLVVGTNFPRLFMPGAPAPTTAVAPPWFPASAGATSGASNAPPSAPQHAQVGPPEGLAVDLLQRVAQMRGWRLRLELLPWPRAQAMVEQGSAQILIGPYRTPERERRFAFAPSAFYEDRLVFFGRLGAMPVWQGDYQALAHQEIAQVSGWAYGEAFEQARLQLHMTTVRDVETGLRMLRNGRVTMLATNERNTLPVLASLGLEQQIGQIEGPSIGQLRGHFACSLKAPGPALCEALEQTLQQLRRSGEWPRLNQKWGVGLPPVEGAQSAFIRAKAERP